MIDRLVEAQSKKDREALTRRIRKLLALTQSSNQAEAEAALLKAQALMIQYGIEQGEITAEEARTKEVVTRVAETFNSRVIWKGSLGSVICDNFRCVSVWSTYRSRVGVFLEFIGFEEDVELAREAYRAAAEAAERLARAYVAERRREHERKYGGPMFYLPRHPGLMIRNAFLQGFVRGLRHKFEQQVAANKWELVLVLPQEVSDYVDTLDLGTGPTSQSTAALDEPAALAAGFKAGTQFDTDLSKPYQLAGGD